MTRYEQDVLAQLTASLIAAISLLEKYHANCAPTKRDALFSTKLLDYNRSAMVGRNLLLTANSRNPKDSNEEANKTPSAPLVRQRPEV